MNNENTRISVVIFDTQSNICIDSIKNQTYKNFDIIFCTDKDFRNNHDKYNDYVCIVDSNIAWNINKLQDQLNLMQNNICDISGTFLLHGNEIQQGKINKETFLNCDLVDSTIMLKKSLLNKYCFTNLYDLLLQLLYDDYIFFNINNIHIQNTNNIILSQTSFIVLIDNNNCHNVAIHIKKLLNHYIINNIQIYLCTTPENYNLVKFLARKNSNTIIFNNFIVLLDHISHIDNINGFLFLYNMIDYHDKENIIDSSNIKIQKNGKYIDYAFIPKDKLQLFKKDYLCDLYSNTAINFNDILHCAIKNKHEILQFNKFKSYITVVTCYYQIKSKFNDHIYIQWIQNFMKIPMNLVIFTDNKNYAFLKYLRRHFPNTMVILLPLEKMYLHKNMDIFIETSKIDPEKDIHSPELYLLWANKAFLIKNASEINPFNSKWFFWTDIGCCRDKNHFDSIVSYPNYHKIIDHDIDKIIFSQVEDYNDLNLALKDNIPVIFKNYFYNTIKKGKLSLIQGGFFAAHITKINDLCNLYESTLLHFYKNNVFCGKDQSIMFTMYLLNKHRFSIIDSREIPYYDKWFSFLKRYS